MKQILALGACALFIACSSSTEKTMSADTISIQAADTATVTSDADSTNNGALTSSTEAEVVTNTKAPAAQAPKSEVKGNTNANDKAAAPVKPAEAVINAAAKKGEMLISKSDCFACHKIQDKLLGPSYKEVANKYEKTKANIDYLVDKIKKGGSGVWGAVPMAPHPALSDEDAIAMVQYILTLK